MPLEILRKPLEELTEADLRELVDQGVTEGRTIDYKRDLPRLATHEEKLEFLADVSSFANASGGILLFGIEEVPGEALPAYPFAGVELDDPDAKRLQMRQLLDSSVKPRIPSLELAPVHLGSNRYVIAVRVRRSWCAPHMVKLKASQRFYGRRDSGKMELEVQEIRTAFLGSEHEVDRVRDFRLSRLALIAAGATPAILEPGQPRLVVHLAPLTQGSLGSGEIDLHAIGPQSEHEFLPLVSSTSAYRSNWNFDGLVGADQHNEGSSCLSYTQVFRSGAAEAVTGYPFGSQIVGNREVLYVPCRLIEKEVVGATARLIEILGRAGAQAPVYAMISLLGVKGYVNAEGLRNQWARPRDLPLIDREDLVLPEVLVEDLSLPPEEVLRPAFNVLWQATGFHSSLCWVDGVWQPDVH